MDGSYSHIFAKVGYQNKVSKQFSTKLKIFCGKFTLRTPQPGNRYPLNSLSMQLLNKLGAQLTWWGIYKVLKNVDAWKLAHRHVKHGKTT